MKVFSSKKTTILVFVAALVTAFLFAWNFYPQSGVVPYMYSDTLDHAAWSQAMLSGGTYPTKANGYPLFFFLTGVIGKLLGNINYAITFVASLIGIATFFSQLYFLSKTSIKSDYLIIGLSFGLTFTWPIILNFNLIADPEYLINVYLKSWSATPVHNLTSLAVRPISLITTALFLDIFKENTNYKKLVLLSVCILISVLIKPSFYQYFSIGVAIYTMCSFLKNRNLDSFKKSLYIAVSLLPATIWVIYSMRFSIDGMQFYPFRSLVLNYEKDAYQCFTSLLRGVVFCVMVFVLLLVKKKITKEMWFIYLCIFIAFLEFVLLIESGEETSFNFSWGYMNAMYITFVYSTKEIFEIIDHSSTVKVYKLLCCIVLILHITTGIFAYINYGYNYRVELDKIENTYIDS